MFDCLCGKSTTDQGAPHHKAIPHYRCDDCEIVVAGKRWEDHSRWHHTGTQLTKKDLASPRESCVKCTLCELPIPKKRVDKHSQAWHIQCLECGVCFTIPRLLLHAKETRHSFLRIILPDTEEPTNNQPQPLQHAESGSVSLSHSPCDASRTSQGSPSPPCATSSRRESTESTDEGERRIARRRTSGSSLASALTRGNGEKDTEPVNCSNDETDCQVQLSPTYPATTNNMRNAPEAQVPSSNEQPNLGLAPGAAQSPDNDSTDTVLGKRKRIDDAANTADSNNARGSTSSGPTRGSESDGLRDLLSLRPGRSHYGPSAGKNTYTGALQASIPAGHSSSRSPTFHPPPASDSEPVEAAMLAVQPSAGHPTTGVQSPDVISDDDHSEVPVGDESGTTAHDQDPSIPIATDTASRRYQAQHTQKKDYFKSGITQTDGPTTKRQRVFSQQFSPLSPTVRSVDPTCTPVQLHDESHHPSSGSLVQRIESPAYELISSSHQQNPAPLSVNRRFDTQHAAHSTNQHALPQGSTLANLMSTETRQEVAFDQAPPDNQQIASSTFSTSPHEPQPQPRTPQVPLSSVEDVPLPTSYGLDATAYGYTAPDSSHAPTEPQQWPRTQDVIYLPQSDYQIEMTKRSTLSAMLHPIIVAGIESSIFWAQEARERDVTNAVFTQHMADGGWKTSIKLSSVHGRQVDEILKSSDGMQLLFNNVLSEAISTCLWHQESPAIQVIFPVDEEKNDCELHFNMGEGKGFHAVLILHDLD